MLQWSCNFRVSRQVCFSTLILLVLSYVFGCFCWYLITVLYVQAGYARPSTSSTRTAGLEGWVSAARPWKLDPNLWDPCTDHELWVRHLLWASISFMSQFHRFGSLCFGLLQAVWKYELNDIWRQDGDPILISSCLLLLRTFYSVCHWTYQKLRL